MKFVVAPNAFKGSLGAFEAADAIAEGVLSARPEARVARVPIADGGDGTTEVLRRALGGTLHRINVAGPLGRPVRASWVSLDGGRTAAIDVASASGLALVPQGQRDPLATTSYGTGEIVRAALAQGCRRILLGVGGSATVDAGTGLLEALGVRFFDEQRRPLPRGGGALGSLAAVDLATLDPRARGCRFEVLCDVDNPLLGPQGAARVFGPQKGATPPVVEALDAGLARWADVVESVTGITVRDCPSAGAAGGIAAGLHAVLGARLLPGIDRILDLVGFDEHLPGADLVITAEGQVDRQTAHNKGPFGVARRARAQGVPVVALTGAIADDLDRELLGELSAVFCIASRPMSLDYAVQSTARLLRGSAREVARLYSAFAQRPPRTL